MWRWGGAGFLHPLLGRNTDSLEGRVATKKGSLFLTSLGILSLVILLSLSWDGDTQGFLQADLQCYPENSNDSRLSRNQAPNMHSLTSLRAGLQAYGAKQTLDYL